MLRYDDWVKKYWKKETPPRVLPYFRISNGNQQDLDGQKDTFAKEKLKYGLNTLEAICDDVGHSPRWKANRKGMDKLIALLKQGGFDIVWVDAFNRFAVGDAWDSDLRPKLKKANIELFSSAEGWLTDDDQKIVVACLSEMGWKECKDKAWRAFRELSSLAKDGRWLGGDYPPFVCDIEIRYGPQPVYRIAFKNGKKVLIQDRQEKEIEEHPKMQKGHEAFKVPTNDTARLDAVRWAFEYFATHKTGYKQVATLWNEKGFPTLEGKEMCGTKIRRILRDTCAIGLPALGKISGDTLSRRINGEFTVKNIFSDKFWFKQDQHDWLMPDRPLWEPLVDLKHWEAVQKQCDEIDAKWKKIKNKDRSFETTPRTPRTHLSGLLVHANCGLPMRAMMKRYVCRQEGEYYPSRANCSSCSTSIRAIEQLIVKYLEEIKIPLPNANKEVFIPNNVLEKLAVGEIMDLRELEKDICNSSNKSGTKVKIKDIYRTLCQAATPRLEKKLDEIKSNIQMIQRRLITAAVDPKTTQSTLDGYNNALAGFEAEQAEIEKQLKERVPTGGSYFSQLCKFHSDINDVVIALQQGDKLKARKYLEEYISSITVKENGNKREITFLGKGTNLHNRTFSEKEYALEVLKIRQEGRAKHPPIERTDDELEEMGRKMVEGWRRFQDKKIGRVNKRKEYTREQLIAKAKQRILTTHNNKMKQPKKSLA